MLETYEHRPMGSTRKGSVYDDYTKMCDDVGESPVIAPVFGKLVKKAFPWVKSNRKGPRGQTTHHYTYLHRKGAPLGTCSPHPLPRSVRKRSLSDPQLPGDGRRGSKSFMQMRRERMAGDFQTRQNALPTSMVTAATTPSPASLSENARIAAAPRGESLISGSTSSFYDSSSDSSGWDSSYLSEANLSRPSFGQSFLSSISDLTSDAVPQGSWDAMFNSALPSTSSTTLTGSFSRGRSISGPDEVRGRSIDLGTEYYHPSTWTSVHSTSPNAYPEETTSSPTNAPNFVPRTNFTFFPPRVDSDSPSLETLFSQYRNLSGLYKSYYDKLFHFLANRDFASAEANLRSFWQQDIQIGNLAQVLHRPDVQKQMLDMDCKALGELGDLLMSNPLHLRDGDFSSFLFGLVIQLNQWHQTALEIPQPLYNTNTSPIPSTLVANKRALVRQLSYALAQQATAILGREVERHSASVQLVRTH